MARKVAQAEGEDRQDGVVPFGAGALPAVSGGCECSCSLGMSTGKISERVLQKVARVTSPVRFVPVLPMDQSTTRNGWQDRRMLPPIRSQREKPNDLAADQSSVASL